MTTTKSVSSAKSTHDRERKKRQRNTKQEKNIIQHTAKCVSVGMCVMTWNMGDNTQQQSNNKKRTEDRASELSSVQLRMMNLVPFACY